MILCRQCGLRATLFWLYWWQRWLM